MTTMDNSVNNIIQYALVGLILIAIIIWIVWKLIKLRKKGDTLNSCCGCAFTDSCRKPERKLNEKQCHNYQHEDNKSME